MVWPQEYLLSVAILLASSGTSIHHLPPILFTPASSPRSSLLPFIFHLRQTPAWLCLNFTTWSVATLTNILTLLLSSRGILTKPTSGRSCRTFTSMYPVQLEDRIHWIIATLSSRMPTRPVHFLPLVRRTTPPFSSHRNINKGSHRNPRWRGKWRVGPPTLKLCCRRLLMTSTGTCSGRAHLTSASSRRVAVSFVNTLTEQATENNNCKDFPKSENRGWTDQSVMRLTNALPHTTRLFCLGICASIKHRVMLSDEQ